MSKLERLDSAVLPLFDGTACDLFHPPRRDVSNDVFGLAESQPGVELPGRQEPVVLRSDESHDVDHVPPRVPAQGADLHCRHGGLRPSPCRIRPRDSASPYRSLYIGLG